MTSMLNQETNIGLVVSAVKVGNDVTRRIPTEMP